MPAPIPIRPPISIRPPANNIIRFTRFPTGGGSNVANFPGTPPAPSSNPGLRGGQGGFGGGNFDSQSIENYFNPPPAPASPPRPQGSSPLPSLPPQGTQAGIFYRVRVRYQMLAHVNSSGAITPNDDIPYETEYTLAGPILGSYQEWREWGIEHGSGQRRSVISGAEPVAYRASIVSIRPANEPPNASDPTPQPYPPPPPTQQPPPPDYTPPPPPAPQPPPAPPPFQQRVPPPAPPPYPPPRTQPPPNFQPPPTNFPPPPTLRPPGSPPSEQRIRPPAPGGAPGGQPGGAPYPAPPPNPMPPPFQQRITNPPPAPDGRENPDPRGNPRDQPRQERRPEPPRERERCQDPCVSGIGDAIAQIANLLARLFGMGDQPQGSVDGKLQEILSRLQALIEALSQGVSLASPEKRVIDRIYRIQGGNDWFRNAPVELIENPAPVIQFQPEAALKTLGGTIFNRDNGTALAQSTMAYQMALMAVMFSRLGLQRFPITTPDRLDYKRSTREADIPKVQHQNAVDFDFWQFKQTDAALGAFPLEIKYKNKDGQDSTIEIENLSEAVSELLGVLLSIDSDTDVLQELGFKHIAETLQNKAAMSLAVDYLRAISDFLGYKSEMGSKKLPVPVNFKANSIKDLLRPAEHDIQTHELKDDPKNDVVSKLNQLLIVGGLLKAALTKKIEPNKVEGDLIKGDLDKIDDDWEAFLVWLRNQPTELRDPGQPNPRVIDRSSRLGGDA